MKLRKIISAVLCAVMLFSCSAVFASAAATTAKVGNNTTNIITVPMTGTVSAVITVGQNSVNKDMPASDHIAKALNYGGSLLASVNGGFFNAYYKTDKALTFPGNCANTSAILVQNGQVINAGGTMPMLGFTTDGKAMIDKVTCTIKAAFRRDDSSASSIWGVNSYSTSESGIYLFTPLCGYPVPLAAGAVEVHIRNGIVSSIEKGKTSLSVASDEQVVVYNKAAWENVNKWIIAPEPGNCAEIKYSYASDDSADTALWSKLVTGVGCGPWLIQNGADCFDKYQTVDPSGSKMNKGTVAQRTFAAVMNDGSLMIGEVSASFTDIINYLKSVGAKDAVALDGGGSSTLVSGGTSYLQPPGRKLSNMLHVIDFGSAAKLPKQAAANDIAVPSAWAEAFIASADENGLIPEGFDMAAKENITRLEFCQLAKSLIQKYHPDLTYLRNKDGISYDDVVAELTDTRHPDIVDCIRIGICKGKGDGLFDPNGSITREEAATMLSKLGDILGFEFVRESTVFPDSANFASYAPTFIDKAYRYGMMDGTSKGFDAKGYFTKEQAVTVFVKILP